MSQRRKGIHLNIAKFIIIAATLALNIGIAKASYLKCELVNAPGYQQFTSQHQKDAFLSGVFTRGVMGFVVAPSDTWMIDLENNEVLDLENGPGWTVKKLDVTQGFIKGKTAFDSEFSLNRVSGKLSYTKYSGIDSFVLEGIIVPTFATWTYQCTATDKPVV